MKAPLLHIRLSKQARDQLITLKRYTSVSTLNIICRWAYVVSLSDPTPPRPARQGMEGGFDISWGVFAGEHETAILKTALLRMQNDKRGNENVDCSDFFRSHIQRGLTYLASDKRIRSITDLASLAINQS
jgi:DNA sulfur modification protein DndE